LALRPHPVLAAVSRGYSELRGRSPRVTHPSATPWLPRAFDLHVLGMPPAFVLSQDQTLRLTAQGKTPDNQLKLALSLNSPAPCPSTARTQGRGSTRPRAKARTRSNASISQETRQARQRFIHAAARASLPNLTCQRTKPHGRPSRHRAAKGASFTLPLTASQAPKTSQ
jgi:hypothetical protein